jgi:hypothetical protein
LSDLFLLATRVFVKEITKLNTTSFFRHTAQTRIHGLNKPRAGKLETLLFSCE